MYDEAIQWLEAANVLTESFPPHSEAAALLETLAFEVLLKAACVASHRPPKKTHDYVYLWGTLPESAQQQILAEAEARMQSHADYSQLSSILTDYQFVFEEARYYYQFYEDVTLKEQHRIGTEWVESGAPHGSARVRYHPEELEGLIYGLRKFLDARLDGTITP